MKTGVSRGEPIKKTLLGVLTISAAAKAADLGFFFLLMTHLSVEGVGVYGLAIAVGAFASLLVDIGVNQAVARELGSRNLSVGDAARAVAILRIPGFLIVLVAATSLMLMKMDGALAKAIPLALLIQIALQLEMFCAQVLKGTGYQQRASILEALDPFGKLLLILLLIFCFGAFDVITILTSILIMHLLVSSLFVRTCFDIFGYRASISEMAKAIISLPSHKDKAFALAKTGISFFLLSLVTLLQNRADWLIVSYFCSREDLGHYSVANKVYEMTMLAVGIAVVTTFPWRLQGRHIDNPARLGALRQLELLFGVGLSLGVACVAPLLFSIFWAEKYSLAANLTVLLAPVGAISTLSMLLYYDLVAARKEAAVAQSAFKATVIQLAATAVLAQTVGVVGAVCGMAILSTCNVLFFSMIAASTGIRTKVELQTDCIFVYASVFAYLMLIWMTGATVFKTILLLFTVAISGWLVLFDRNQREVVITSLNSLRGRGLKRP